MSLHASYLVYNKSQDITKAQLYEIIWVWNGQRLENKICVWADSPDPVNELAKQKWNEIAGIETSTNLDGSQTKPGEKYEGFACFGVEQGSLLVFVDEVNNASKLGSIMIKNILKTRNITNVAKGKRGKSAQKAAAAVLNEVLLKNEELRNQDIMD